MKQSNLLPTPTGRINPRSCFVLMPFASTFTPTYLQIKTLLEKHCGVQCLRADEIFGSHSITTQVWISLNEARFLIADLTGRNPNVFYELGLAHALAKNVLLLTQQMADVPFDVNHIRVIPYDDMCSPEVEKDFINTVRTYISTIPTDWAYFDADEVTFPYIKLTRVEMPQTVSAGEPFEIEITARNMDNRIREGYFSISFPDGVDFLPPTDSQVKFGTRGMKWCGGQVRLQYPIFERIDLNWAPGIEHLLRFQGSCSKKGLLWIYLNASSTIRGAQKWEYDPPKPILDIDQRREPVYCAVIEVV